MTGGGQFVQLLRIVYTLGERSINLLLVEATGFHPPIARSTFVCTTIAANRPFGNLPQPAAGCFDILCSFLYNCTTAAFDRTIEQAMITRIFWTLLFVGACVGWLLLSYHPGLLTGREVAFGPVVEPLFVWCFVASALLFVSVQLMLVAGVRTFPTRIFRAGNDTDGPVPPNQKEIRIHPRAELLWTALPLVISLFFFWASFQTLLGGS